MNKFRLVSIKYINLGHFQMWEGKFQDVEQKEHWDRDVYVYANIGNNETETFEESDVRVYAHSFETLYCAEDYELIRFYSPMLNETLNYFKEEILKAI